MSERRLLALLSLLLCIVAGVVLILDIFHLPRELTLDWVADRLVELVIGIVILVAGLVVYGGRYLEGGVLALIMGVVVLVFGYGSIAGILTLIGGVLGIVAESPR